MNEQSTRPVSYTHLDVYKRQGQLRVDGHPGQQGQTVFVGGLLGLALPAAVFLVRFAGFHSFLALRCV